MEISSVKDVEELQKKNQVLCWASDGIMLTNGDDSTSPVWESEEKRKSRETNIIMPCKSNEKDLESIMSKDITFTKRKRAIIVSSKKMAGWIFRTFSIREVNQIMIFLKTLIFSRCEYCGCGRHCKDI